MLRGYESSAYHPKIPLIAIALMALIALMICYAMFSTAPEGYPGAGYPSTYRYTHPSDAGFTRDTLKEAM